MLTTCVLELLIILRSPLIQKRLLVYKHDTTVVVFQILRLKLVLVIHTLLSIKVRYSESIYRLTTKPLFIPFKYHYKHYYLVFYIPLDIMLLG